MITASELAEWVYSREEWRKRRLGLAKPDQRQLDAGTQFHDRKDAVQRRAGASMNLGRVLIVLGVIALLAALLWQ